MIFFLPNFLFFLYQYLSKNITFYVLMSVFCFVIPINLSAQNNFKEIQSLILKLNYEQKEDYLTNISEDSIRILLKNIEHPIIQIDLKNILALKLLPTKISEAEKLLYETKKESKQYEYIFGQYWNVRLQSWVHQLKDDFEKAKYLLLKAIAYTQKIQYKHGEALCYRFLAELSEKQNFYKNALENYQKAIDIHEETNNIKGITSDYWRVSIFYDKLGNYEFAIEANEKSLEQAKKLNQIEWIIRNYNRMALSYQKQGNFQKALEYLNKGYELYTQKINENLKAKVDFATNLHALAKTYASMSKGEKDTTNNKKAFQFFNQSIDFQQKYFKRTVPETYIEKGILCNKLNQIKDALGNFEKAEKYALIENNNNKYITSMLKMAEMLLKLNSISNALAKTKLAYQMAHEKKLLPEKAAALLLLSDIYTKQGNIKDAFISQKQYQNTIDTLTIRENRDKSYQIYQQKLWQDQRNEVLIKKEQNRLQQKNEIENTKLVRNTFVISLAFALLGILIIGLMYRKQKRYNQELTKKTIETEKQRKELQKRSDILEKAYIKLREANQYQENLMTEISSQKDEINQINKNLETKIVERTQTLSHSLLETARLNDELDAFLYHASHDLRRPITTLFGLYELAKMTLEESKKSLEIFDLVKQTAFNMDKMLTKLIMIHEINNVKKEKTKKEEIKFGEIIQNMQKIYTNQINEKNMTWKIKIENNLNFLSDKNLIEFIIQNLIENAVIFSQGEKPFLRIKINKQDNFLRFSIEDNGQGIDTDIQNRIFEMYFRGSEQSQGNGLGLYVVHRAVHHLKGRLEFNSEIARGSTFEIYLPFEN